MAPGVLSDPRSRTAIRRTPGPRSVATRSVTRHSRGVIWGRSKAKRIEKPTSLHSQGPHMSQVSIWFIRPKRAPDERRGSSPPPRESLLRVRPSFVGCVKRSADAPDRIGTRMARIPRSGKAQGPQIARSSTMPRRSGASALRLTHPTKGSSGGSARGLQDDAKSGSPPWLEGNDFCLGPPRQVSPRRHRDSRRSPIVARVQMANQGSPVLLELATQARCMVCPNRRI